jgi:putative hemolysin
MPAEFDACVNNGGKVITKKLKGGKYIHICYPKGGGQPVAGEVKQKEEKK